LVCGCKKYLLTWRRYIELNTINAGMVENRAGYKWLSYRDSAQRPIAILVHMKYTAVWD
jgi:hypothetical protein